MCATKPGFPPLKTITGPKIDYAHTSNVCDGGKRNWSLALADDLDFTTVSIVDEPRDKLNEGPGLQTHSVLWENIADTLNRHEF
jgi:hypothetical protein